MTVPAELQKSIANAATGAIGFLLIALVYVVVVHFWKKVAWRDAVRRTGLVVGSARWWGIAALLLVLNLPLVWFSTWLVPITTADTSSPYHVLIGRGLNGPVILAAAAYGFVSAGFGEELLFRGLIAGALGRRMALWKANLIQGAIFVGLHLLLLLVKPEMIFLVPGLVVLTACLGWVRLESGSIGPSVLIHGGANTFVGLVVATSTVTPA